MSNSLGLLPMVFNIQLPRAANEKEKAAARKPRPNLHSRGVRDARYQRSVQPGNGSRKRQ